MGVADILQQMGENARRAALARGQVIGSTIADVAAVPAQIDAERERQAIVDQQRARFKAQDARLAAADDRATKDQARQDAAATREDETRAALQLGIRAGWSASNDPKDFDVAKATQAVAAAGHPELATALNDFHTQLLPKLTEYDPTKGLEDRATGAVVRPPAAKAMTPAEQALRDETARHNRALEENSALTAGRTAAAEKETERHNRATEAAAKTAATAGSVSVDLEKMPADQRAQAQALVDGRRSLDPRLASKPYGQAIINAAYQIDPTFDQGNYNARSKARADLTSPSGTGGKTISALNTAIQHAGKLSDLIETLDNSEYPAVNAVVNPLRSMAGSTKVTNFDTVAPQLAKEIERVWRGAGGTAGEIHDLIETIGANKGKQQQREALQQFVELAQGKLNAVEQQRDNAMGAAGKSIPVLFDQSKPIIDRIAQRASGTASAGVTVTSPGGKPYTFKTQAEADAAVAKAKAAGLWK